MEFVRDFRRRTFRAGTARANRGERSKWECRLGTWRCDYDRLRAFGFLVSVGRVMAHVALYVPRRRRYA